MDWSLVWVAVAACAGSIQTIVLIVAAWFGFKQLREAQRARTVASFFPLFDSINSAASAAKRRALHAFQENDPPPPHEYTAEEEDLVNGIVNQFDFLGFLVSKGLLEGDLLVAFYYGTVIRAWRSALPYVQHQRALRGTRFAGYFEDLRDRCVGYVASDPNAPSIARFNGLKDPARTREEDQ